MKILFVGHYRDGTAEGEMCRNYLRACIATGHEVVARPVYSSNVNYPPEEDILNIENRFLNGNPDIVVQNVRPEYLKCSEYTNVGISLGNYINHTNRRAIDNINSIDIYLAQSESELISLEDVGVNTSLKHIPPVFEKNTQNIQPLNIEDMSSTYNFYFIDEYNNDTNLLELILAFNKVFSSRDNVRLLIYSWIPNVNPQDTVKIITEDIRKIKNNMRIYQKDTSYLPEIILTPGHFHTYSIHKACDCLISPVKWGGYNKHILEALDCGNRVILTDGTYMHDILENAHNIYAIKSRKTICQSTNPNKSAWDEWRTPDLEDLDFILKLRQHKIKSNIDSRFLENFSIESIAEKLNNVFASINN